MEDADGDTPGRIGSHRNGGDHAEGILPFAMNHGCNRSDQRQVHCQQHQMRPKVDPLLTLNVLCLPGFQNTPLGIDHSGPDSGQQQKVNADRTVPRRMIHNAKHAVIDHIGDVDQCREGRGQYRAEEIVLFPNGKKGFDLPVLYGGSVKPDNAKDFIVDANCDGLLVGGASLDPVKFSQICKCELN